jgi:cytochrome c oxidase subunit 2
MWEALAFLLQVQIPGAPEHRVADIFKPLASPAASELNMAKLTLAITGAIFVVVGALIVYTMWRYRRKPGEREFEEPPQVYGSNQIELAWTVLPVLIVFVLIGVSARVIRGVENASPPPAPNVTLHVTLIGHQWWWEVRYPAFGVVTANEIHVPVTHGSNYVTYFRLESADVIHSLWVPQLAGKTDLIPNRENSAWIDPTQPGVYLGNCAEYCGTQHANMLLRVVAQEPADFERWAANEARPAVNDPSVRSGRALFESLSCINCHAVRGTRAKENFGPDLTHLMTRQTLGAGVLANTLENLRNWINDPQRYKPGCLMPAMKLTDQELNQIVAYLETLK